MKRTSISHRIKLDVDAFAHNLTHLLIDAVIALIASRFFHGPVTAPIMSALFTVAYPFLDEHDRMWIESFRSAHDKSKKQVIAAHFTLLFGTNDIPVEKYLTHVESIVKTVPAIRFCCRYAMLCADQHDDSAYIFLVPDEGYSNISMLHDALYTGPLTASLRLDFPYIPHITVGRAASQHDAKQLCDVLNAQNLAIAGVINTVTVGSIKDGVFANRARMSLRN